MLTALLGAGLSPLAVWPLQAQTAPLATFPRMINAVALARTFSRAIRAAAARHRRRHVRASRCGRVVLCRHQILAGIASHMCCAARVCASLKQTHEEMIDLRRRDRSALLPVQRPPCRSAAPSLPARTRSAPCWRTCCGRPRRAARRACSRWGSLAQSAAARVDCLERAFRSLCPGGSPMMQPSATRCAGNR